MPKTPTELEKFQAEYYARNLLEEDLYREVQYKTEHGSWITLTDDPSWEALAYRWKQDTILVNGIEVRAPCTTIERDKTYFIPAVTLKSRYVTIDSMDMKNLALPDGILHTTPEAAIAHAEAMLAPSKEYMEAKPEVKVPEVETLDAKDPNNKYIAIRYDAGDCGNCVFLKQVKGYLNCSRPVYLPDDCNNGYLWKEKHEKD